MIVPPGDEAWRDSIVQPIPYAVSPAFSELGQLVKNARADDERQWQESLSRGNNSARSQDTVSSL